MGSAGLRAGRVGAHPGLPLLLLLLPLPTPAPGVTCPTPSAIEHADIRVKSYLQNSRERYTCHLGFKRKAGTSSLTECVYNKTTGTARWTRPTLQCIRDPSLAQHQPSSTWTAAPAGVTTPKPQSSSSSGKDPLSPLPEPVTSPGSGLKPSGPLSAGPPGAEQAPSPSADVPTHSATKLLWSTPALVFCGLGLLCTLCYLRWRWGSRSQGTETDNPEELPMTGAPCGANGDPENRTPPLR